MLEKIKLPETMAQKIWDTQQTKHEEKENMEISKNQINKIMEFRNSNDFYELAILLLLVSGRREQELLNLNPHQTDNAKAFMFNQQQKKKKKIEHEVALYNMEFNEFKMLINKIKALNQTSTKMPC
jgi:hypothetical protein